MIDIVRQLRARRSQLRDAVDRLPIVGPAALAAFRAGRDLIRARTRPKPAPQIRPERFIALYKQRKGIDDLDAITDPVKKLHVSFALSTVERGTYARDRIAQYTSLRGKRCLDVGCAYGGFLVAFAQAGASRVVGIDLNPELLDYARALLQDYSVDAEVRLLDVLASDGAPDLGKFDVITCNDVIEHVLDPAVALARLVDLLAPGGVLYMEIPNRFSASFVEADGHYRIYGITALPKHDADRYYAERTSLVHDVTYKSLPFYINTLARHGAAARLINFPRADVAAELDRIARVFAECERKLGEPIPGASEQTQRSLRLHVERLAKHYRRLHERQRRMSREDPRAAHELGERLFFAFGCDFWTLLVEKREGSRPAMVRWSRGVA